MKTFMPLKQSNIIAVSAEYITHFFDVVFWWQEEILNMVYDYVYPAIAEDFYLYEMEADTKQLTTLNLKTMTMIEVFQKEMEQEAQTTRKMLQRVPDEKFDWQPHKKSMTLQTLATHVADLPSWVKMAIETDELDFNAKGYVPKVVKNNKDLMDLFEKSLEEGRNSLKKAKDDILSKKWVMRGGDTIYTTSTKGEIIRMTYCQIVHHRAQLGVFLRLLDVPIPGSYGPSADEPMF